MFTRAHGSLTLPEASTLEGGLSPFGAFFFAIEPCYFTSKDRRGPIRQLSWDFLRRSNLASEGRSFLQSA
jgi:hypothetical protein